MLRRKSHVLFFICVLCSCQNSEQDKFVKNIKKIHGELMEIDGLIGRPSELIINDTLLFVNDRYENKVVSIIDVRNNKIIDRVISIGKGPGEVLPPLQLFIWNGDLCAYQRQTGFLNTYDNEYVLKGNVFFDDQPAHIIKTNHAFVGFGPFEKGRFHSYSLQGKLLSEIGEYPFDGNEKARIVKFLLYQGYLCCNPDGDYFAFGCAYSDNLEFYKITDGTLQQKYGIHDVKAQYKNGIELADDCIIGYKWAYGSEKFCYMLYSGKTYAENDRSKYGANKIIVFDWNGKYIKSFETDTSLTSFCVDEQRQIIYGLDKEEEGILKFQM
jgi:hypothetical protein